MAKPDSIHSIATSVIMASGFRVTGAIESDTGLNIFNGLGALTSYGEDFYIVIAIHPRVNHLE